MVDDQSSIVNRQSSIPNPQSAIPNRQSRTPPYVVILATVLACVPILAVAQFAALCRVDDIDSVLFAYYGKRMVAGQQLYVDLWDNKPPGIFWIDAAGLWLAQGYYAGIVVVCSLATLGSATLFFLTARRLYSLNVAAVGTVLAALYINLYYYHVGSNRPSTFYVFFELLTLLLYCRAFDRGRSAPLHLFLGGASAVGAICFRQTVFAVPAAIVVHQLYLLVTRRRSFAEVVGVFRPMAAGAVVALLAVIGLLWWTSDPGAAWHGAVVSNLGYVTESKQSRIAPQLYGWRDHEEVLALPLILAAAAVIHGLVTRVKNPQSPIPNPQSSIVNRQSAPVAGPLAIFVLLVAWLPIATYLALIGPHRAYHYYGIALPPLLMLATHGVWLLMRRDDESRAPRFYVILAVLWFIHMSVPVARLQVHSAMAAYNRRFDDRYVDRWGLTVDAILEHTDPQDTLFSIRYQPWVFWRTNRPLAHPYILETMIDQWQERSQPFVDEVIGDLKAAPPKAIIASRADVRNMEQPDEKAKVTFRDLGAWLRGHYTLVNPQQGDDVWIRNY
ncbi:MAG: glycosyltransferase family 39 protein [Phycisphaerae bacterium]